MSDARKPYAAELAANVRAARARADLTQKVLAGRMQVMGFNWSPTLVAKLEAGNRPLLATELLGLALALGCSIPALTGASEDEHLVELPSGKAVASATVRRLAAGEFAASWETL